MKVSCAIAMGSNLGDSSATLAAAVDAIDALPETGIAACSHLYRTAPVGPPQPDYLNRCVIADTALSPEQLLQRLLGIEAQFGRVRRERWGPRSLDLDLLLYGTQVVALPQLQVPHPRMHERAFVLVPLAEIAPGWSHPLLGETVAGLAEQVDPIGVVRLCPGEPPSAQPVI